MPSPTPADLTAAVADLECCQPYSGLLSLIEDAKDDVTVSRRGVMSPASQVAALIRDRLIEARAEVDALIALLAPRVAQEWADDQADEDQARKEAA